MSLFLLIQPISEVVCNNYLELTFTNHRNSAFFYFVLVYYTCMVSSSDDYKFNLSKSDFSVSIGLIYYCVIII